MKLFLFTALVVTLISCSLKVTFKDDLAKTATTTSVAEPKTYKIRFVNIERCEFLETFDSIVCLQPTGSQCYGINRNVVSMGVVITRTQIPLGLVDDCRSKVKKHE